jgi:outer membrane protein insertion porin family
LIVTLTACSPTRYLTKDQALVKKLRVKGVDKEFAEEANLFIQKDLKPNSPINLAIYNFLNTKKGKYRTDRIRNAGEPPHILDTALVDISRTQIELFLKTKKGFFNAKVKSDITVKKKKATVTFTATEGPSFKVRDIEHIIPDPAVKSLFEANTEKFYRVKPGSRFDLDSLEYERDQVYRMMKQHGYYDYIRQYMTVVADTNLNSSQVNLKIFIDNPENKSAHEVYTINNTSFFILNSSAKMEGVPDSAVIDSQYYFKDYSKRFKPSALKRYIFFKKNDLYNINDYEITFDRLYDLNIFKSLKIDYIKTSDSTNRLNPRIEAVPLKRMSNRIEGEYTFNAGQKGFNVGNTYTNRNLFGGAEQLELKFRYGILFDQRLKGFGHVFNRDRQIGANLVLPRLLVPFPVRQTSGRNGLSHTIISSSLQLFDQINTFRNRIFINSLTYNWAETIYKLHSFTPINIEYRDGLLDFAFKEQLRQNGYELYIRTNDRQYINLGSQYTYTLNGILLNRYNNFFYFKGAADIAGNTLDLLGRISHFSRDTSKQRTIRRIAYLQYAKTELDFRFYRSLGKERQFIARFNPGIAVPYSNTEVLPFEKNFYAGGSSGVRAWQARTLGPGSYNRSVLGSETLRKNLRNLDQLGEIKLESNLEYRFKILNNFFGSKLKGATFTDFGNIWRLSKENSLDTPGGVFRLNKFLNQLAIGTGAGLRFDLEYFIFRFDAGIKVKDPQFSGSNQWVITHLFNYKNFRDAYYETNKPDTYKFIQYNFGVGMPF